MCDHAQAHRPVSRAERARSGSCVKLKMSLDWSVTPCLATSGPREVGEIMPRGSTRSGSGLVLSDRFRGKGMGVAWYQYAEFMKYT